MEERQTIKRYYAKMYNNYIAFIPDKEMPFAHASALGLEQWYEVGITEADAIFEEAGDDVTIQDTTDIKNNKTSKQVYSECFFGGASLDLQTEDYLQLFDCEYLHTVDEYNVYKNIETGDVFVIDERITR